MKKFICILLLGAALLAGSFPLVAAPLHAADQRSSPYEKAIAWIAEYSTFPPRGLQSVGDGMRRAEREGEELQMVVGEGLMKCKTPYLLQLHQGRLYWFELTPQQARALDTAPNAMTTLRYSPDKDLVPATRIAAIEQLQIDEGQLGRGTIAGRVKCRKLGDTEGKLCVHLWFRLPKVTITITKPLDGPLPEDGALPFSVLVPEGLKKHSSGPVAFFLTLGTRDDGTGNDAFQCRSNTVAALVDYGRALSPPVLLDLDSER